MEVNIGKDFKFIRRVGECRVNGYAINEYKNPKTKKVKLIVYKEPGQSFGQHIFTFGQYKGMIKRIPGSIHKNVDKLIWILNDVFNIDINQWEVHIKGKKCNEDFEITVIRKNNKHGHLSYGWFDDDKLLISHNGTSDDCPLTEKIWNKMIKLADEVAEELNLEESTC